MMTMDKPSIPSVMYFLHLWNERPGVPAGAPSCCSGIVPFGSAYSIPRSCVCPFLLLPALYACPIVEGKDGLKEPALWFHSPGQIVLVPPPLQRTDVILSLQTDGFVFLEDRISCIGHDRPATEGGEDSG